MFIVEPGWASLKPVVKHFERAGWSIQAQAEVALHR